VDEMGKKITETIEKPVVGLLSWFFGGGRERDNSLPHD
jgi:hypothetical protein